ncbi:ATP-dependent DNA helicase Q4-like isoform X2 [Babylonia areolata]|uniref:ATP-dependent DNA helicase Q4-like isoform X2 n=1 Tax=Babylonia areolata TaxID=304850 RepID=UPI003FD12CEB
MTDLITIKKKLKEWESAFFTVHQRKPEKDDINSAPDNIKDLYHTYHASKRLSQGRAAQQDPSKQENRKEKENADFRSPPRQKPEQEMECSQASVWGPEFNKKPAKGTSPTMSGVSCSNSKQGNSLLNKLGDKLFAKCAATTALAPKKKSSFARMKSLEIPTMNPEASEQLVEDNAATSVSRSRIQEKTPSSSTASDEDELRVKGKMFERAVRLSTGKKRGSSDEIDISKKFVLSGRTGRQFLVTGNPDLVNSRTMVDNSDLDGFSQTFDGAILDTSILGNDLQESDGFCNRKKVKSQSDFSADELKRHENKSVSTPRTRGNLHHTQTRWHSHAQEDSSINTQSTEMDIPPIGDAIKGRTKRQTAKGKRAESQTAKGKGKKSHQISQPDYSEETTTGVSQQSTSEIYTFSDDRAHDSSLGDGATSHNLTQSFQPPQKEAEVESSCQNDGHLKTKRKQRASAPKRQRPQFDEDGIVDHGMENQEVDPSEQEPVTAVQPAKKRRVAGPTTLSAARKTENFVRLNMKAKKFVRKGSRMTGGQWKRKQWKQKMAARSKSYGNKCFKCGQSGHWASKCPGGRVEARHMMDGDIAPVDEHAFPSLRSAALMAQGAKAEGMPDLAFGADEELEVEAMIVRDRYEPESQHTPVAPFSQTVTDVEEELLKGLSKFGFASFRQGQKETITRILNGESTLVVLSTGGGKSLCYQLPAYLYAQRAQGIALVVSPLVSLMEDQVTGLPPGVRGACLNSAMTPGQRDNVLSDVNAGKVHFLLVSPEAVVGAGGRGPGSFPSADKLPPIFFACIDEVHCLSEWSHNFRPSYLRICKVLRDKYGVGCFLGLTATATKRTAADVGRHLGISDLEGATIRGSPVPPNLCLSVSRDENRDEALVNLLQGKRFSSCSSVIIYCTRREQVERVATLIRTCLPSADTRPKPSKAKKPKAKKPADKAATPSVPLDVWTVESYHAGLTPAQRKRVQGGFMEGRVRVVVATVAFGMGLDKADVRGIIHYNMPKSFENYVQEIGRAGRDGELSHCHLFLDPKDRDLTELQRHTFGSTVDRYTVKRLLQRVFTPCRCRQVMGLQNHGQRVAEEERNSAAAPPSPSQSPSPVAAAATRGGGGGGERQRVCPGHERALVTQQLVHDLDVREEGIETLLCYVELHAPHLLSSLSPVYATCRLQCYGGPSQLQALAHRCPPVAVAIAKQKLGGRTFGTSSSLEFPVVELSDSMGWDSGPVKRELRALQWVVKDGEAKKSGVMVTFTDLALRVRACGDISDEERDALVDYVHGRVRSQESSQLAQLSLLARRLKDVSHKNYWMCADEADSGRSERLKRHLDSHFEDLGDVGADDGAANAEDVTAGDTQDYDASTLCQLTSDVQQFIQLYGAEHLLTARAVARVLHGIDSPRFPATTWGRVRRFWRAQLHVHFNVVLQEATRQLLRLR